ncbi:MAG: serine/threonine protein kinase, partial [Myxococcales bacterium]|nr:serine/threonine protein kinase [Myxococcales bacterium]
MAGMGTLDEHTVLDMNAADALASATPLQLERGRCVGRYVLLRRLGAGGMGVVWAAWDPDLDREVAIKLLHRGPVNDKARSRLLREAQALARITHPNIVSVYDVGIVEQRVFVAMEYVRGQTLRALFKTTPPKTTPPARSWREVVDIHRQAALGLAAAHEAGLVHRDFKPDNAMIDEHGRVRVMDFGLAAIADEGPQGAEPEPSASHVDLTGIENLSVDRSTSGGLLSAQLTEVGRLVGTPAFMAPEQLAGRRGGPAADQFALCVSTWQTLTGERPYPGDDVEALLAAMHAGKLRTPGAAIPKELRRVLERGLATEPEQRWPSMAALAEALEAVQRGSSRTKLLTVGAAVVMLATAAVGGGLWSRHGQQQRCADVDDGWSEAQRDAIAEAMTRAGDHGRAVWIRAEPVLETWSAAHRRVTASACREDDGLPPALRVAQAVCLDRQRRALAETLELLRTADAATAARALDMVGELPDPSHCADAEHLAALDRRTPPRDAEGAAAVNDAIFRGRALLQAGRHRDAVAVLDPLRATASELGAPAVEGELQATLGEAELALGLSPRATASLGLAYASLLRAGEDQAAAAVAVLLISAEADQAHGQLARLWDLHAEALIARAGDGAADTRPLRAQRLTAMAVLADGEG